MDDEKKELLAQNAEEKFARVDDLHEQLNTVHQQNINNIAKCNNLEEAECLEVIMSTGIRPGGDLDRGAVPAYGATTLEGRMVVVDGNKTRLQFVGKKGVDIDIEVVDPSARDILLRRKAKAGDKGKLFNTDGDALRDYVRTLGTGEFTTKDFRTHLGTTTAESLVKDMEEPTTKKEYMEQRKEVALKVSKVLGNTPAVAMGSYVHPKVLPKDAIIISEPSGAVRKERSRTKSKSRQTLSRMK